MDNSNYMSKKDVRTFIGGTSNPLPNSTLYDWIKTKNFPRPIYITPKAPFWRKSDVVAFMEARANKGDKDAGKV